MRVALLATMLWLFGSVVAPCYAAAIPAAGDPFELAARVVELTNRERVEAGLLPVRWDDSLASAALAHARDMAARGYFAHNSPEGGTVVERAEQAGYPHYGWGGLYVGENLARGYSSAEGAVQGWMASEGHRHNLLNPRYREIGVGVAVAPGGVLVWAQEFGSRPGVLHAFINGDVPSTDTRQVTLSVTTEEVSSWGSVGSMAEMMVSNRPDFSGSSWEPYSRTRSWILRDEPGTQRVYVRLRDTAGMTVECSDDIHLETRSSSIAFPVAALSAAAEPSRAEFRLGFQMLASTIPDVVGVPLANERSQPNGDSIQPTSNGLLVWRKADNWTAFTNGSRTWINGPLGLQERGNGERFPWEAAAAPRA